MQCRFCLESSGPMIEPCLCRGSVRYIHRACLNRWILQDGIINQERLVCSLCNAPLFDFEIIPAQEGIVAYLFNITPMATLVQYFFLLASIKSIYPPIYFFRVAQLVLHIFYTALLLYSVRVKHLIHYRSFVIKHHAYLYWFLYLYSIYSFFTENKVIMAFSANTGLVLLWKQHIRTLEYVNEYLIKN